MRDFKLIRYVHKVQFDRKSIDLSTCSIKYLQFLCLQSLKFTLNGVFHKMVEHACRTLCDNDHLIDRVSRQFSINRFEKFTIQCCRWLRHMLLECKRLFHFRSSHSHGRVISRVKTLIYKLDSRKRRFFLQ